MSDVMLPVAYATVSGWFLQAVADATPDGVFAPDMLPMEGTVTFTPNVDRVSIVGPDDQPMMVFPKPVDCSLDAEGWLIGPDGDRDVMLIATGDIIPTYRVQFSLEGVRRFSINITAPANQVTDLALALELPDNPSADIPAWEAAATAALEAAERAEAAAAIAQSGIEGPQGDPGPKGNKGEKGDTGDAGIDGVDGADGADGPSAYDVWVAAGNVGTVTAFLASLKGAKGDPGIQGIQGIPGIQGLKGNPGNDGLPGSNGAPGLPGSNGADGKSAYQVWLDAGNSGNVAAYLLSLKGAKGDKGDQGLQGIQGIPGTNGQSFLGQPAGTISMWTGAAIPADHLECNGAAVSRTTYSALFAIIGTTHGAGDGSTTFNVPNYADKFMLGAGANTVGSTGGSATHAHGLDSAGYAQIGVAQPGGAARVFNKVFGTAAAASYADAYITATSYATGTSGTMTQRTALGGSTDAASSLPPWAAVRFIIKTSPSNGSSITEIDTVLGSRMATAEAKIAKLEAPPYWVGGYAGTGAITSTPASPAWVAEASSGIAYTDGGSGTTRYWTAPRAGIIHVTANINFMVAVDPNNCYVIINKNGTTVRRTNRVIAADTNGGASETLSIAVDIPVAAGDQIAIQGRTQTSSTYFGDAASTFASLRYVA